MTTMRVYAEGVLKRAQTVQDYESVPIPLTPEIEQALDSFENETNSFLQDIFPQIKSQGAGKGTTDNIGEFAQGALSWLIPTLRNAQPIDMANVGNYLNGISNNVERLANYPEPVASYFSQLQQYAATAGNLFQLLYAQMANPRQA